MSQSLFKQSLKILEQGSTKIKSTNKNKHNILTTREFSKQNHSKEKQDKKIFHTKHKINKSSQKSKQNLKKLLALSKNTLKDTDAEKIVKRAHKGRYVEVGLSSSKKELETPFTEEDFRAFEEEYFKS